MFSREMSIGAAIAALKKEIADRQAAAAILEALIAHRAAAVLAGGLVMAVYAIGRAA